MEYNIQMATENNIEEILDIYHSLIGKDGCTWDFDYPNTNDVKNDINKNSLYIVLHNQEIVAVAAAGEDDELNELDCYNKDIKMPCDLARITVKSVYQNKGIAKYLVKYIERDVIKRGFDGIHFLVSKTNPHAKAVYDKLNYLCCGECVMYQKDWYCYEKKLK